MGYDTWHFTMAAKKFTDDWEAVYFLLSGRDQELFDKLNIPENIYEAKRRKKNNYRPFTLANWEEFLHPEHGSYCPEEGFDMYVFIRKFGFGFDKVFRQAGLCFEHEGDARCDVEWGWLGLELDEMGDDETKNEFRARVKGMLERYSGESLDDLEIVSFSFTG